jgi:hypothetical protein
MSADNTIAILRCPLWNPKHVFEYRVKHLQAIENLYYDEDKSCDTDDPDILIKNARKMWCGCRPLYKEDDALQEAKRIYDDVGFTEYGIQEIFIPRPFSKK